MPNGERVEGGQRETVATLLSGDPTWGGVVRAGLLLSVLWWAWSAYAWLTNTLDPEEGGVRMAMFVAVAAMLIASIAAPRAFGRDAATFALAYLIVRALYLLAHVALRLRIAGGLGRGRPIAAVLLIALLPVATHVPAAGALGMVAAICVALIAYEVLRHREGRALIRAQRGALSTDDIARLERP